MTMVSQRKKGRQRLAAGPAAAADALSSLQAASIRTLHKMWLSHFRIEAPAIRSTPLFRRLLAWELQAKLYGALDSATERKLRDIAAQLEREGDYEPQLRRDFYPGVLLTREWKGTVHRVTVVKGGFQYLGKQHKSLSEIARLITGTRWSGPRFFGLEQRKSPKPKENAS